MGTLSQAGQTEDAMAIIYVENILKQKSFAQPVIVLPLNAIGLIINSDQFFAR